MTRPKKSERIKVVYDHLTKKKGKPPTDSEINRIADTVRKRPQAELDEHIDWDSVHPLMKPLDKYKGPLREVRDRPPTKKYFH